MKKHQKIYGVIFIALILVVGITIYSVKLLSDKNKLTAEEKRWITDNQNNIQNLSVLNDLDVFGKDGSGVFYDFIHDFETENGLKINPITYKTDEVAEGIAFIKTNEYDDAKRLVYKDHYVLVSKNIVTFSNYRELSKKSIGVLEKDEVRITSYLALGEELHLTKYASYEDLFKNLNNNSEINFAIVPLNENLENILNNGFTIGYHFSDLNNYYYLSTDDTLFGSIILKSYNKWEKDNLDQSIKKNQFKIFTNAIGLSSVELDKIDSKTYEYGFINQSPYEIINSGNYGGIVSYYVSEFSKFANLDFHFTKYKNFNLFSKAIHSGKVDMYYDYYNFDTEYATIPTLNHISYSVIANIKNDLALTSINGLKELEVYALNDSKIASYLKEQGIKVKTYQDNKELFKLNKKDVIIVMDSNIYDYYHNDKLDNYTERYTYTLNDSYNFKIKDDDTLYKLFLSYVNTIDPNVAYNEGILNHTSLVKKGNIYKVIVKYVSILAVIYLIGWLLSYRLRRKVKIAKRIKKSNKIQYIDRLTLLKNRDYFMENLSNWNKNTVYPQTIIIIDLNRVHEINDTLGYDKGDKQIKAAANILIKTQLDNSEIIRTDGNEFMVYCVGYTEKQIASYIRKLNKDFKYLPYEYGATIGKSFITSEIKSVDDALNEAIEDMKLQKEEIKEEK